MTRKLTAEAREQLKLAIAVGAPFTDALCEGVDREQIVDICREIPVLFRGTMAPIEKAATAPDDGGEDRRSYLASVQVPDRRGDIVQIKPGWITSAARAQKKAKRAPRGLVSDNFLLAGGPLLWAHRSELPPVGSVDESVNVTVDAKDGVRVAARMQTASLLADGNDNLGTVVATLAKLGRSLRCVSIGAVPVAEYIYDPDDPEERARLGLGRWGVVFGELDQVELSLTPTPANPLAVGLNRSLERAIHDDLSRFKAQGLLAASLVDEVEGLLLPISPDERAAAKVKSFASFSWTPSAASPPVTAGEDADDDATATPASSPSPWAAMTPELRQEIAAIFGARDGDDLPAVLRRAAESIRKLETLQAERQDSKALRAEVEAMQRRMRALERDTGTFPGLETFAADVDAVVELFGEVDLALGRITDRVDAVRRGECASLKAAAQSHSVVSAEADPAPATVLRSEPLPLPQGSAEPDVTVASKSFEQLLAETEAKNAQLRALLSAHGVAPPA